MMMMMIMTRAKFYRLKCCKSLWESNFWLVKWIWCHYKMAELERGSLVFVELLQEFHWETTNLDPKINLSHMESVSLTDDLESNSPIFFPHFHLYKKERKNCFFLFWVWFVEKRMANSNKKCKKYQKSFGSPLLLKKYLSYLAIYKHCLHFDRLRAKIWKILNWKRVIL